MRRAEGFLLRGCRSLGADARKDSQMFELPRFLNADGTIAAAFLPFRDPRITRQPSADSALLNCRVGGWRINQSFQRIDTNVG
jgi:hypothetical protein